MVTPPEASPGTLLEFSPGTLLEFSPGTLPEASAGLQTKPPREASRPLWHAISRPPWAEDESART